MENNNTCVTDILCLLHDSAIPDIKKDRAGVAADRNTIILDSAVHTAESNDTTYRVKA